MQHGKLVSEWVLGLGNRDKQQSRTSYVISPGDSGRPLPHTGFPDSLLCDESAGSFPFPRSCFLWSLFQAAPTPLGPFHLTQSTLASTLPDNPGSGQGLSGCDRSGVAWWLVCSSCLAPVLICGICFLPPCVVGLSVFGEISPLLVATWH